MSLRSNIFLDDGDDVVAEYVDEDDDGDVDRKRIYWLLKDIDQRIGFMEIDDQGDPTFYYYLRDQVGSVIRVIRSDGTVANQYDYDAFGNLIEENVYETVANRYRFQGREWDEHRKDYYFRNRTYVPEWGSFTGPDPRLELEPNGPCNYLFANNNPPRYVDPEGLWSNVHRGGLAWARVTPDRNAESIADLARKIGLDPNQAFGPSGWFRRIETVSLRAAVNQLSPGFKKVALTESQDDASVNADAKDYEKLDHIPTREGLANPYVLRGFVKLAKKHGLDDIMIPVVAAVAGPRQIKKGVDYLVPNAVAVYTSSRSHWITDSLLLGWHTDSLRDRALSDAKRLSDLGYHVVKCEALSDAKTFRAMWSLPGIYGVVYGGHGTEAGLDVDPVGGHEVHPLSVEPPYRLGLIHLYGCYSAAFQPRWKGTTAEGVDLYERASYLRHLAPGGSFFGYIADVAFYDKLIGTEPILTDRRGKPPWK